MENNKTRRRFNVIDALIILIVIGLIAGVAYRYNIAGKIINNAQEQKVIVSYLIKGVRGTTVDSIQVGDVEYFSNTKAELGTIITKGTPTKSLEYFNDENGDIQVSENEEKYDIRIEIEAYGQMTDEGFMLHGTQYLAPNSEIEIYSKHVKNTVIITGIRTAE